MYKLSPAGHKDLRHTELGWRLGLTLRPCGNWIFMKLACSQELINTFLWRDTRKPFLVITSRDSFSMSDPKWLFSCYMFDFLSRHRNIYRIKEAQMSRAFFFFYSESIFTSKFREMRGGAWPFSLDFFS